MRLKNSDGETVAWIYINENEDGEPHFILFNRYGDTVVSMGSTGGDGGILVLDKYGNHTFKTP